MMVKEKAEAELGDEEFHQTEWPETWLLQATSVEERCILVGEENNIQRLISGVNLVLEDILGTGVLGWKVSTKTLSQEKIDKISLQAETVIEKAAEQAKQTNLENPHRVTIIASKKRTSR